MKHHGMLFTLLAAAVLGAAPAVETGELNGAAFRIDMPENWNGVLVIYCHGYNVKPVSYTGQKPEGLSVLAGAGFAVAQSGYSAGGWAIEEALVDTEALRRYFIRKHGQPKRTYVTGHSMGGFLTMTILETQPNRYDGGLALCGPLAPASHFLLRNVFDLLVVFEYFFPGALPPPAKVPPDYTRTRERDAAVEKVLEGNPERAAALRRLTGIRSNKELAATLVFFTYILKDIQQRAGGNPFDNRNTIYGGTGDDNAVNDGVSRHAADPRAAEYVRTYYTPTGRVTRPFLHVHTTYDALVPSATPNYYAELAAKAGSGELFVQQYVKSDGHCAIQPEQIAGALADLRRWAETGAPPAPGPRR